MLKKKTAKLSYKQQQILDKHPEKIEAIEARIAELNHALSDPKIYQEIGLQALFEELEDKKGEFNDEPTEKFYCPECVKNGFKNKKKGRETPEEFLKHNKIKDKVVVREFKKICKTRGKGRSYTSILKEAVEVASYYE